MKIFCDLDGVLVNFRAGVENLGPGPAAGLDMNAPVKVKDGMYRAIEKAGPEFWSGLTWTDDGKQLWEALKPYNPTILSSPGQTGQFVTNAEQGKKTWLDREIPGVTYHFYNNKFEFAERDAVLIDDMKDNVDAWIHCGGEGILHKDAQSTLQALSQLMKDGTVDASTRNADEIPSSWIKDREKIKDRQPEDNSEALVQDRAQSLANKAVPKTIKQPNLFLRDLDRVISYIHKDMRDPRRNGLIQDMSLFRNDFRIQEPKLPDTFQAYSFIKAGALSDSGELVEKLSKLFNEDYNLPVPIRRKTLANAIRELIASVQGARQR